jgi:hypothetical protein
MQLTKFTKSEGAKSLHQTNGKQRKTSASSRQLQLLLLGQLIQPYKTIFGGQQLFPANQRTYPSGGKSVGPGLFSKIKWTSEVQCSGTQQILHRSQRTGNNSKTRYADIFIQLILIFSLFRKYR